MLDSLARALRAGYPLSAAMEMIATETAPPVSGEMRRTSAEANLGRGWPHALENLGQRIPLLEVNLFIAAVQLHARTGGKLSEVMGGLAENMRESIALQGEVRSLAAYGKLTGMILTILPIGIAIMMMFVSPGYMQVLFNHPMGQGSDCRGDRLPGAGAFRDSEDRGHKGMTLGTPGRVVSLHRGRGERRRIRVRAAAVQSERRGWISRGTLAEPARSSGRAGRGRRRVPPLGDALPHSGDRDAFEAS